MITYYRYSAFLYYCHCELHFTIISNKTIYNIIELYIVNFNSFRVSFSHFIDGDQRVCVSIQYDMSTNLWSWYVRDPIPGGNVFNELHSSFHLFWKTTYNFYRYNCFKCFHFINGYIHNYINCIYQSRMSENVGIGTPKPDFKRNFNN